MKINRMVLIKKKIKINILFFAFKNKFYCIQNNVVEGEINCKSLVIGLVKNK